jgi:hypothetical protein
VKNRKAFEAGAESAREWLRAEYTLRPDASDIRHYLAGHTEDDENLINCVGRREAALALGSRYTSGVEWSRCLDAYNRGFRETLKAALDTAEQ